MDSTLSDRKRLAPLLEGHVFTWKEKTWQSDGGESQLIISCMSWPDESGRGEPIVEQSSKRVNLDTFRESAQSIANRRNSSAPRVSRHKTRLCFSSNAWRAMQRPAGKRRIPAMNPAKWIEDALIDGKGIGAPPIRHRSGRTASICARRRVQTLNIEELRHVQPSQNGPSFD